MRISVPGCAIGRAGDCRTFTYNDFSNVSGLTINRRVATGECSPNWCPPRKARRVRLPRRRRSPRRLHRLSTAFEFNVTTKPDDPTDGFTFLLQNEGVNRWVLRGQGSATSESLQRRRAVPGRGPSFIGVVTDGIDPLPGYPTLPPGATTFDQGVL